MPLKALMLAGLLMHHISTAGTNTLHLHLLRICVVAAAAGPYCAAGRLFSCVLGIDSSA